MFIRMVFERNKMVIPKNIVVFSRDHSHKLVNDAAFVCYFFNNLQFEMNI